MLNRLEHLVGDFKIGNRFLVLWIMDGEVWLTPEGADLTKPLKTDTDTAMAIIMSSSHRIWGQFFYDKIFECRSQSSR